VTNDLDGGPFYLDPNQSSILRAQTNGLATLTLPATGTVQVTTGNLRVGNGTNGTTLNGEDAYIEGTLEVDGVSNFAAQMTVLDDILVGSGTPTITQNGGDIFASDQFEVDGEAQFDGAMDVNGAVDLDGETAFADGQGRFVRERIVPAGKHRFAYRALRADDLAALGFAGGEGKRLAVLQCVGSRDPAAGRGLVGYAET
jgi:hypothetical protein